ncbi:hypothetical protein ACO0SA_002889 [Hanseniaspora valbyensis]
MNFDQEETNNNPIQQYLQLVKTSYQSYLDKSTPHLKYRWSVFGAFFVVFFIRIITLHGFYVVCYGYSIFLLNQFLLFLSPKFDMTLQQEQTNDALEAGEEEYNDDSMLYKKSINEKEFRPFIRKLPEFKFWYKAMVGVILSLSLTLFSIFDLPVFWPILVAYFILLTFLTMRAQIQHMIKYKYIPFDLGKKKYNNKAKLARANATMSV